jgi:GPH family glycoside/pentoside/hexuronide:cation symporter
LTSAPTTKLPLLTKLLYGLGSMALGANAQMMGLLLLYYNQIVGLSAQWVSLALAISIVIDALWDPFIGQISDGLRTRLGRRHPFMYLSAVPVAVSFVLLWAPPQGWSDPALFGYLLGCVLLVRLTTSFYEVPSAALAPELAPDYHDRTTLLSYRYLLGTLGSVAAAILAFGLFLRPTPEQPMGQLNAAGYGPLAFAVGLLMVTTILISTAGTHHMIPRLHKPPARKAGPNLKVILGEVATTLRNWNFGVAVLSGLVAGTAAGMMAGLHIYFSTYFWELPASSILILMLVGVVSTPFAIVTARLCSARWGKRLSAVSLFIVTIAVHCAPILLRLLDLFPENGSPWIVPLLTLEKLVAGTLGIAGHILTSSMVADIVEENQVKTGRRSEGLLLSADSVLTKLVSGFATILPGIVLTLIAFPQKAKPGSIAPEILDQLGWVYIPVVTILVVLSASCWAFFRIEKSDHDQNLATIREGLALAERDAELRSEPAPAASGVPPVG